MNSITPPRRISASTVAAIVLLNITHFGSLRAEVDDASAGDADRAVRLEDFEVSEPRKSAQTMAPTENRLDAVQPASIINLQTIQNSIAPTADYAMIANLAPSVTNFTTNGPGLNESKPTIRGFADGQYNVTIDGIPFGDGNDFTHHTTSYFPAKLLGRVTVDRGPGTASTIGMATFGGTIAMETKDPRSEASFVPTLSYGSYKTELAHFEVNSGILPQANGGSFIGSYQYMTSDGYRTFGTLRRSTYFFKYLQPIGKNTVLSFMGEYNNIKFNNPNASPLTLLQIYTLGRNFGQTNNPLDTNGDYYGSNYQSKQTDTGFIGIDSDVGSDWKLSGKVYTFSYNNSSHESPGTNFGPSKKDLGGQFKVNSVRTLGSFAALSHDDSMGTFKTGVWYDYQHGPRYKYALDYSIANAQGAGLVAYPAGFLDTTKSGTVNGWYYNMHFYTETWEPYVEYAWRPLPALTITPGLKYMSIKRQIAAPINQTTDLLPLYFTKTYSKAMPLATVNYRLSSDWSAYAQYATGFLAPPLAFFQENHPQNNNVSPQTTTNYQIGTVYKTNRFNVDLDAYWIDYKNFPVSFINPDQPAGQPVNPNDLITFNAKGAKYYGVEAEGTYYVGSGLSIFANASRNYAKYKGSDRRVDSVPQITAGYGLIYENKGFFGSVFGKYIGPYTVYSGAANPDLPLPAGTLSVVQGGYTLYDLSLGYGRKVEHGFIKSYKIRLQTNNLFNRDVLLLKAPKANALSSTYNPLTLRDYFLTISTEF